MGNVQSPHIWNIQLVSYVQLLAHGKRHVTNSSIMYSLYTVIILSANSWLPLLVCSSISVAHSSYCLRYLHGDVAATSDKRQAIVVT